MFKYYLMRKIVYYVATSIDGYIEGPNQSIEKFIHQEDIVDHYKDDLQNFDTIIMGRNTYEFGYNYGLVPGQPAYPHMQHYIFSETLHFENPHEKIHVVNQDIEIVKDLKTETGTDIYLCGGGIFAGWLLENELIDVLKIKLNPIILGSGTPLFGPSGKSLFLEFIDGIDFQNGFKMLNYNIKY